MHIPPPHPSGQVTSVEQLVRVLQIIYIAMFMGIVIMAVVLAFVASSGSGSSNLPPIISLIHGAMALSCIPASVFLFATLARQAQAAEGPAALQKLQVAYIVRLALLEGMAMFGLVTLLLIGKDFLSAQPIYWLNIVSVLLYMILLAVTFPTPERVNFQLQTQGHR